MVASALAVEAAGAVLGVYAYDAQGRRGPCAPVL